MLLKTNDRVFEKGRNKLVFERKLLPNTLHNRDFCEFETRFAPFEGQTARGYMAFQFCSGRRKSTGAGIPMKCRKPKKDVKIEGTNSSKSFRILEIVNKRTQNEPQNKGKNVFLMHEMVKITRKSALKKQLIAAFRYLLLVTRYMRPVWPRPKAGL